MFSLSTRVKEAIKLGLAMVIAYGIAMQMGWENPFWAALTVATASVLSTGQSHWAVPRCGRWERRWARWRR